MTPARRRLLELIKSEGAQTASELAERIGVTPVAVRQHLQTLCRDGLLVYVEERRPVGRPARRWRVSEAAQPCFPDSHREFAVGLIEAIDGALGGEAMQRLVEERVRRQIRRYRRRMRFCGVMSRPARCAAASASVALKIRRCRCVA